MDDRARNSNARVFTHHKIHVSSPVKGSTENAVEGLMAVTIAEQAATRKATHFGERLWGEVARGIRHYSPAGALARARGVMFEMNPTRALVPKATDEEKAYQALRDLVEWLGLRDSWAYLESIKRNGAKIFDRVPVPQNLQNSPQV